MSIDRDNGSIPGVIDVLIESLSGKNVQFWADLYSGNPAVYSQTSIGHHIDAARRCARHAGQFRRRRFAEYEPQHFVQLG